MQIFGKDSLQLAVKRKIKLANEAHPAPLNVKKFIILEEWMLTARAQCSSSKGFRN
jgi:hypothetical protein